MKTKKQVKKERKDFVMVCFDAKRTRKSLGLFTHVKKRPPSVCVSNNFVRASMIPLGGADSIGRSCYLYLFHKTAGRPFCVLVDAGIQPGVKMMPDTYEEETLPAFHLIEKMGLSVDAIVITHGHLDHCGALVFAARRYPNAPIFMSFETKVFTRLQLEEGLKILKESRDKEMRSAWRNRRFPYDERDMARTLAKITTFRIGDTVRLCDGLDMHILRAGHILGAAMCAFVFGPKGAKKAVLHTGDASLHDQCLVKGAQLPPSNVEALVNDSTNLGSDHDRVAEWERLVTQTTKALNNGGKVLFPVFVLHRAQDLVERILREPNLANRDMVLYGPSLSDFTVAFRHLLRGNAYSFGKIRVEGGRGSDSWKGHMRKTIAGKGPTIVIASGGMGGGAASACTEELLYHGRAEDAYFNTGYFDECTTPSGAIHRAYHSDDPERYVYLGESGRERRYEIGNLQVDRFHLSGHGYDGEVKNGLWRPMMSKRIVCVHCCEGAHDTIKEMPTFNGAQLVPTFVGSEVELA